MLIKRFAPFEELQSRVNRLARDGVDVVYVALRHHPQMELHSRLEIADPHRAGLNHLLASWASGLAHLPLPDVFDAELREIFLKLWRDGWFVFAGQRQAQTWNRLVLLPEATSSPWYEIDAVVMEALEEAIVSWHNQSHASQLVYIDPDDDAFEGAGLATEKALAG